MAVPISCKEIDKKSSRKLGFMGFCADLFSSFLREISIGSRRGAVNIIGGADGPTAIFVATKRRPLFGRFRFAALVSPDIIAAAASLLLIFVIALVSTRKD